MADDRRPNRQFWLAIGFIVVLAVVALIAKTIVYEMTKPVYDEPFSIPGI
jgi:ABC-type Na+ efflux pump permease subunit